MRTTSTSVQNVDTTNWTKQSSQDINNRAVRCPIVAIGCPVQNREEVILEYLKHLDNLNFAKERLVVIFYVNNSTDKTYEYLKIWKYAHEKEYLQISILNKTIMKGKQDDQRRTDKPRDYNLFANVRNAFLKEVLRLSKIHDIEYLFSVDSDVFVEPHTLLRLLYHEKDIISALIHNTIIYGAIPALPDYPVDNFNVFEGPDKDGKYYPIAVREHIESGEVFEVAVTGACILISMRVLNEGVKYGYHKQGEDVCFCRRARYRGYRIHCDPTLRPVHMGLKVFK